MAEIPDWLEEILLDNEIENMKNRNGWRRGTAVLVEDGEEQSEHKAWIEVFDGEGESGVFDGVKIYTDDTEVETYGYENRDEFEASGKQSAWFVKEYEDDE